jgi:hypothetical protein
MRYYIFTEDGRWFIRNEDGTFGSFYFDSFDELVNSLG